MSDFLAIDWEQQQLCGIAADAGADRVRVHNCFRLVWPDGIDPVADPAGGGRWLKEQFQSLGVSAKQCLVTLPREDVVVRHLELPQVPAEELPDLVRFQASTKSSLPLDQLRLDYLPLPARSGFTGNDVLMATVPIEVTKAIAELLQAAGMELAAVGISPIAATELVVRTEPRNVMSQDDASLVIARHGNRVEISVIRQQHLIFTHSARLMVEDEQKRNVAILAEISRALVALQKQLSVIRIVRAWVLGEPDENTSLLEALTARLQCDVQTIDPLSAPGVDNRAPEAPGNRALYAGPVGMLLSQSSPLVPTIDYLHPRRPAVKRDRRKLKAGLMAAGVLLLLGLGYSARQMYLSDLDSDLAEIRDEDRSLGTLIKRGQPVVESAELVAEWERDRTSWLMPMNEVVTAMAGTERTYLTEWRFETTPGKHVGKIRGTGQARERADVDRLNQKLVDQKAYQVRPKPIMPSGHDQDYRFRFDLDVDLDLNPPVETETAKTATTTTAKKTAETTATVGGSATKNESQRPSVGGEGGTI